MNKLGIEKNTVPYLFFLLLLESVVFNHYLQGAGFVGWPTKEGFCLSSGISNCTWALQLIL